MKVGKTFRHGSYMCFFKNVSKFTFVGQTNFEGIFNYGGVVSHLWRFDMTWVQVKAFTSFNMKLGKTLHHNSYDSLQSSHQRLEWNMLPLSNVKFAFCGFRTKNETCWEACFGHPIKVYFYQKPIFIEINDFHCTFINFTLKLLEPSDPQIGSQNWLQYKPKALLYFLRNYWG